MLSRAVKSALAQDVNLEVVVVDDGSPDPIVVAQERVKVLRLAANSGAAAARNAGVAAARAEWIAFLDSDDVWTPGSLRARLDTARGNGGEGPRIWVAGFADVWPDGRRTARVPRPSARLIDFASGCWTCPGSTALLTRSAWSVVGGQDENLRRLEDYDWLLRWALRGGAIAVHESIAAEITRGRRPSPQVIDAAANYIREKHQGLPAEALSRMNSYLALESAAARLGAGEIASGAAALMKSWLLHPRLQPALERFWSFPVAEKEAH